MKENTFTNVRSEEKFRDEVSILMKEFVSEIINNDPDYPIHTVAEELNVKAFNPMKIGAVVEKNTESSRNNYRLQKSMLYYMEKIEFFFHKELYSDEEAEEVGSKASMLSLASNLLFLGYGIDLKLHHMIDCQTDVALSRATMAIRNECHRFLKSREFLDYLKEKNIAFFQCGDDFIIQMLSGSFNVNTGRYEYGHILSADGICLDPSMKGWDMIIFLMYT